MKMAKKSISIIVIVAFVIFSESCVIHRTRKYSTESLSRGPSPKASIVRVLLKSGETREFGRKDQVHFINGAIVRRGPTVTVRTYGSADVSRKGDLYIIKTGDGRTYRTSFYSLDTAGGRLTYATQDIAPIPLSEVALIWTRDVNTGLTILLWLPVGLYLLAGLAWSGLTIFPGPGN
jgi:hypothetical protein